MFSLHMSNQPPPLMHFHPPQWWWRHLPWCCVGCWRWGLGGRGVNTV